jgi:hypothetical protein
MSEVTFSRPCATARWRMLTQDYVQDYVLGLEFLHI